MSDGPNRWEVAAPLPLYSWGRQWNVRADPIERTPHDPMRSTSTAPIDSEEPINNSSIAAASRSESEASGPSKASGPLEFDFISSEAPIDTFEIDAANSLISEISGSSRPNGLKLRPGQSLADRSSTAMEQLQVTAAQAADCRRAELGNGPGTLDGAEADTAQEISERLKTLEPNLSRSHRYPAKFWPMLGLSVGTAGSVCLVLLMHLGETKPVVIATADPGTRSTPTAEDAPLDQQLLGKSLSAQRILAERKAPASQTGKVSVDEPVGSSPAAMDPASARSVAGTPMAPPPEVIKETRSAGVDGSAELSLAARDPSPMSSVAGARAGSPSEDTNTEIAPVNGAAEPSPARAPLPSDSMATASLQLPWASSTEPSLSSPTNGATVSAGDNPPQVRLDTPLSAPIGAPSQTEAAPTATPDKAFPAPDGAIVERVITQQASTQAPSQPSGRTVDALALMARGDALFRTGDVVAARLFYGRAVDAGNPAAAIRLGETFDPSFLAQAQLRGVRGDPAAAIKWYTRARELGASEADTLVTSIERK